MLDTTLLRLYKVVMLVEYYLGEGFERHNVQPGKDSSLPVCPHYSLLEICANFVGIESDNLSLEDPFCGRAVKYENNVGFLSGHRGNSYFPRMACMKIYDKLEEMIYTVKQDVSLPEDSSYKKFELENDSRKREILLKETHEQTKRYNNKQDILNKWRTSVYEISCIPPESKQSGESHFEPRSIDDLTNEEIIETVEKFFKALENNVTGKKGNFREGYIRINLSADHCPETPHLGQTGEIF